MDYTRTSNLAHCYGQGEAGVYTLQTGRGSEVQKPVSNISAPSYSLAPTRCCIFREYLSEYQDPGPSRLSRVIAQQTGAKLRSKL